MLLRRRNASCALFYVAPDDDSLLERLAALQRRQESELLKLNPNMDLVNACFAAIRNIKEELGRQPQAGTRVDLVLSVYRFIFYCFATVAICGLRNCSEIHTFLVDGHPGLPSSCYSSIFRS